MKIRFSGGIVQVEWPLQLRFVTQDEPTPVMPFLPPYISALHNFNFDGRFCGHPHELPYSGSELCAERHSHYARLPIEYTQISAMYEQPWLLMSGRGYQWALAELDTTCVHLSVQQHLLLMSGQHVAWSSPSLSSVHVNSVFVSLPLCALSISAVMRANTLSAWSFLFSSSSFCIGQNAVWSYGPRPAGFVCSNKFVPPLGKISLKFSSVISNQHSPLRFEQSAEVCVYVPGGGFKSGYPDTPTIDIKQPIEPQIRSFYVTTPTISCVRVSDGASIIITSVQINFSRGQFAGSLDLTFCSAGDAARARNKLLRVTINGYDFYGYAEQFSERRIFGDVISSALGRTRSAELSEPYQYPINYTNLNPRSLAGVIGDLLDGTGWTFNLGQVPDFNIPSRAVSVINASVIDAVNTLAAQIGCMLSIDDANRIITIAPRWPVLPWAYGAAVPDVTLHDAVIFESSHQEKPAKLCDHVFCRGEQVGISAKVKRSGSAGVTAAADFSAPLIVTEQAARLAGTSILADTGNKRSWSITCPILNDLPPLRVGMLVGVRHGASIYKAICQAVTVRAVVDERGSVDVVQSIELLESLE